METRKEAKLIILDVDFTIIDCDAITSENPTGIDPALPGLLKSLTEKGFKIVVASDADENTVKDNQATFAKGGISPYIHALAPENCKSHNKLTKINRYKDSFNLAKDNIYYYDDAILHIKISQKNGYVNSYLITRGNTLVQELIKLDKLTPKQELSTDMNELGFFKPSEHAKKSTDSKDPSQDLDITEEAKGPKI